MRLLLPIIAVLLTSCATQNPFEQGKRSAEIRKEIRDRDAKTNHGIKLDPLTVNGI